MMVLDDGWFGKRDDDNSGLVTGLSMKKKIRGGLPKLSEKIHEKGMKFGLWFEPEMISEDSDLYRAHPDWAITIPGRVPNHSRNQLVLDMTRSDVRDYLMARFEEILGNTKIEYVKWDMNRSICDMYSHIYKGEQLGECYHAIYLAFMICWSVLYSVSLRFCLRAAAAVADVSMPECCTIRHRFGAVTIQML